MCRILPGFQNLTGLKLMDPLSLTGFETLSGIDSPKMQKAEPVLLAPALCIFMFSDYMLISFLHRLGRLFLSGLLVHFVVVDLVTQCKHQYTGFACHPES